MRTQQTSDADVATVYAAHRVSLVRLAYLLIGDPGLAESLVQDAFLGLQRRSGRSTDPGSVLSSLQAGIVTRTRRSLRTSASWRGRFPIPTGARGSHGAPVFGRTASALEDLPLVLREVVVLRLWEGLGVRPTAAVLGTSDRVVVTGLEEALSVLGGNEPQPQTKARVTEALHAQAYRIDAADLRSSFGDVLSEGARRTAKQRRWWLTGVATVVVLGLVLAGITAWTRRSAEPTPAPPAPTPTTEPLPSPALGPGELARSAIPWGQVGPGWVAVATAAPPNAVMTTLLLVSPSGTRYAVGTSPEGMVIQDVSPDGRKVLLGVGTQAEEWDLAAGTSRDIPTPLGWKTMRYAGRPEDGYLVLWVDPTFTVGVERWTADGKRRSEFPVSLNSLAGTPGTPSVVLSTATRSAVLSLREGGLLDMDLDADTIGRLPQPRGASGCQPRSPWSPTEVAVVCDFGAFLVPVDGSTARPLLTVSAGASRDQRIAAVWRSTDGAVVQTGDPCSTAVATLPTAGQVTSLVLSGQAAHLVPNTVVGNRLYLGGTQCPTDGTRLVAYDLTSGAVSELVGEDDGRRTVREAWVIGPAD